MRNRALSNRVLIVWASIVLAFTIVSGFNWIGVAVGYVAATASCIICHKAIDSYRLKESTRNFVGRLFSHDTTQNS